MADVNAKAFELLGKYVSFKYDSNFDHIGVIDSVSFYLDGRVEIGFADHNFYDFTQISNLEILEMLACLDSWYIYEISGNP